MKNSIWLISAGLLVTLPLTPLSAQISSTHEVVGAAATPLPAGADAAEYELSAAQLDQMLAPIALYPDSVLTHILIAATYPLEVVEADRWRRNNSVLSAEDALRAVENQSWDASVKALVAFPQLLARMSEDLRWTQDLGDAFLISEAAVMDRVQVLRNDAYQQGELASTQQVKVIRQEKIIVIEPAVERYVYLPHYDTRAIYGNWRWTSYPPVYWQPFYPVSYSRHTVYWGPAIRVSPTFYFGTLHWSNRHVVVLSAGYSPWPLYYSSISLSSHRNAVRWQHDSRHRRGVNYHPYYVSRQPNRADRRSDYRDDWRPDYRDERRADYRPDQRSSQRTYDTRNRVVAEPHQRNDSSESRYERPRGNGAEVFRGQSPRETFARQTQSRPEQARQQQSRPEQSRYERPREESRQDQRPREQQSGQEHRPREPSPQEHQPREQQSRPESRSNEESRREVD